MILPARIAARYLRAPKSHSAVSAISIISVVGVAVATAAIICVLSVFNGFRDIIASRLDSLAPDIIVTPAKGKVFADADSVMAKVENLPEVRMVMPAVIDNALAIFDSHEMPVTLHGVDFSKYSRITAIDSLILTEPRPDFSTLSPASGISEDEDESPAPLAPAVISIGTASQLAVNDVSRPLMIFAPIREGRVNLANPISSFVVDSVAIQGIFQAYQSDYDEKTVICDINTARNLFQYSTEASALEIALHPGADPQKAMDEITAALGPSAVVKDRMRQQEMNFRMISIEKWVTFLLLFFILVIASFNIISTLCMLVLEKQHSLSTLRALGMRKSSVAAVFRWESFFVSLIGGACGILLGVGLCLLQEHFGLIRLAGDPEKMVVTAYPVLLQVSDIFLAAVPVVVTGGITALIAGAFARSRM